MSQRREKKIRRQMREQECRNCWESLNTLRAWAAKEPPAWRIFAWRR